MCNNPTPTDCWGYNFDVAVSTVCNDCGYQEERVFDTCPSCGAEDVWQGVLPGDK